MKKLLFAISTFTFLITQSQTAQFAWIAGSTFTNQPSIRGTKGIPSGTNVIGGRYDAAYWSGNSNSIYLLGGTINNQTYNDLWRYDISLNQWVWLSGGTTFNQPGVYGTIGIASTTNTPGSRYGAATWTDTNGDLWMFGGNGNGQSGTGYLQDLWKYTISDNKWTWVSGSKNVSVAGNYGIQNMAAPTNTPGPRENAVTWVDNNGNLWLFGGYGLAGNISLGYLSDLWKFDVTLSQWIWVSGNSVVNSTGVYGTKGVAGTTIKPSGRQSSVSWMDTSGNLWLFGGFGKSSTITNGNLNDIWKYNTTTSMWTWMAGSNLTNASTVSGIQGVPSTSNTPSARMNSVGWIDGNYFWLFGGAPYASSVQTPYNDLWVYNVTNNTWTWVEGTFAVNQVGVYGTQNVLSQNNIIGSRQHACSFKDINGDFMLFGGLGYGSVDAGSLNDLWKIDVCYTDYAVNTTSALNQAICSNQTTTLSASGSGNLGWYSAVSGGTYLGSGGTYLTPTLTTNTTYYVQDSTCGAGPRTAITVTIKSTPVVAITGTNLACANSTVSLNSSGAVSYTWSTAQNGNNIIVTPSVTTTYTVIGTGANTCTNSAVKTITINPLPTLTVIGNNVLCSGQATTLTVSGANTYTWSAGFFMPTISVSPLSSINYSVIGKDANNCTNMTTYSVTVNPLPTISIATTNSVLCSGQTATLSVTGASTYTWSDNSNGAALAVTPTSNTTYTVTGVDANNCSNSSVFTQSVSTCTSIDENILDSLFRIFPNPNNGEFTIQSQKEDVVTIFNELAQVIETIELNQQNNFSCKVNSLQSGIYFLAGKTVNQKVIVTK